MRLKTLRMKIGLFFICIVSFRYAKVLCSDINYGQLLVNGRFIEWVTVWLREGMDGLVFIVYYFLFIIFAQYIVTLAKKAYS
jgi:hypothetical protein